VISSARLAILVPARGTPAFRPLIPGATSSSPLLIDPPAPSSESWSAEGRAATTGQSVPCERPLPEAAVTGGEGRLASLLRHSCLSQTGEIGGFE
jgi:hypothetical protein